MRLLPIKESFVSEAAPSAAATLPLADTSDMAQIHQVFRDAVGGARPFVESVTIGDTARTEYVGSYFDNVLCLLHVHHEGEDALLTPLLLDRATPDECAEVQRVADQHALVLGDLDAAEQAIAAWRANPTGDTASSLISAMTALDASLTPHLDEEQQVVCPIAAKYVNVAEWGELPGHGMAAFTGDKMWLILGLIQEQFRPEQIAVMEAHMPPPVLDFWKNTGQRMYSDYVTILRRGA
jgi:hypothetical protein